MSQISRSFQRFSMLLLASAALASSAQAQTSANVAVAGSPIASRGALMERAAPADTLHLVFALSSRRRAALDAYVQSQYSALSPNYHHWLTPSQFGARFGADSGDIAAVTEYARSRRFTVTQVWPNHLFISVDARAGDAERAFGVKLHGYLRPRSETEAGLPPTFHAPDRAPTLPSDIAARLQGLFGLSTESAARPAFVKRNITSGLTPATVPSAGGAAGKLSGSAASPADISTFYGFDRLHAHGFNGDGQSIAIYSPTQYSASDFAQFETFYSLGVTTVTEVPVNGGPTDAAGADEAALDLDVTAGQAPRSHIFLYEGPNDNGLEIWNKIAADNLPVVSVSYGNSEQDISPQHADAVNTILQQMSAQGQSMFVASGDTGAYDGNNITPSVDFPASSPFVTAVGGTSVSFGGPEIGWTGSGGGLSAYFTIPSWQRGPGVVNASSNGSRQTPDIAALADPNSPGYNIFTGGVFHAFGGTSASTPLWAAANVLFNQGLGGRTGQLTPALYGFGADAAKSPVAFNDILQGDNSVFSCTAGWDYVTGWGSPKADGLYSLIVPTALGPNPPVLTLLTPASAPAGSPAFTLTLTGSNFTAASKAIWNGAPLATQFVSTTALTATVPASLLTVIGSASVTVADPESTIPGGPLTFTVTTAHTFAAGLQMISAPYDGGGASFAALLGTSSPFATWDANLRVYVLSPAAPCDTFHLGRAYWTRLTAATDLVGSGTPAPAGAPFTVSVAAGWNMVANPFNADASIVNLQVNSGGVTTSFAAAAAAGTIGGTLYRYDSGLRYYVAQTSGALPPYFGYWLFANNPCGLIFPAPTLLH